MQATAYCRVNYRLFLDKDNKVVAYQLDESSIQQSKYYPLEYPSVLPCKTHKTIILNDIWSIVIYEKENISDEQAKIISYKINESTDKINELIKTGSASIVDVTKPGDNCPAFIPTGKEYKDRNDCEHCANKYQCYVQR